MKTTGYIFLIMIMIFCFSNCKKKATQNSTPVTNSVLPGISTSPVTQITDTTAMCGGTVTSEGASALSEVGICWDTLPSPTTLRQFAIAGSGTGSFASKLTNLKINKKYYVRAYAKNANGTAYGNELSFLTPVVKPWIIATGSSASINCLISSGASIYAGTSSGVIFSSDTGNTWTAKGLSGKPVYTLLQQNNMLYATTAVGELYLSSDNGSSWQLLNGNFPYNVRVYNVAATTTKLFAGTDSSAFYSTDNGNSWTRCANGLYNPTPNWGGGGASGLCASGQDVYAFSSSFAPKTSPFAPAYISNMFKYDESANTWQGILAIGYSNVNSSKICGNRNFVSTSVYNGNSIGSSETKVSTDGGSTWSTLNTILGCVVDVCQSNVVLSGVNYISVSVDGGATWSPVNTSVGVPPGVTFYSTITFISGYYLWRVGSDNNLYKYRYR